MKMTLDIKTVLAAYFIIVNIVGFIMSAVDKSAAKRHKWRVPEKNLFAVSLLGGAVGTLMSMLISRHKTKHKRFMIGIPLIIFVQLSVYIYIIFTGRVVL